jgi:hypothetical protein
MQAGAWPRRCKVVLAALVGSCLWLGAAQAQVWGYVDERGVAHFAAERVDERYELFHKGEARVPDLADASAATETSGWETPFLSGRALPQTGAVVAPARVLSFFEVSPRYKAVRHLIREAADAHGLEPELLQAVIAAESGFDARAVSPKGAVGLMQLMPATAQEHGLITRAGVTPEAALIDPRQNIQTGARVLARLFGQFPERLELVVAAYNAGEGAVRRAGRQVPDFPETRKYVQTVLNLYQHLLPPRAVQEARQRARLLPPARSALPLLPSAPLLLPVSFKTP